MNYINQIVKKISDKINGKYRTHADALSAVNADPQSLRYVSKHLRNNREIVMAAVNGRTSIPLGISILKYAINDLRNDPEVVIAAVRKDARALRYASTALRTDKEFVLQAMQQNLNSMCYTLLTQEDMQWVLQLPAQAAIENQEAAVSKILGCVGMFVDQMRKDCGSLKKEYESNDISFENYYEHIVSYISVRDIGLLSQLSTNRYVEDESEAGKIIKRSPRRENEHKNNEGMLFASITKEDREKGVKRFVNVIRCPAG